MSMTYYHNPRCSKSRQGLAILEAQSKKFTIKEYLKEDLTIVEVENLFKKLSKLPLEVMRTKEAIFKELKLKDQKLSNTEWAKIIVENPILLERPILVTAKSAVIGRPPEELETII